MTFQIPKEVLDFKQYIRQEARNEIIQSDDGYHIYYPRDNPGYYGSFTLRIIAELLDELNKEWDDQIRQITQPCSTPGLQGMSDEQIVDGLAGAFTSHKIQETEQAPVAPTAEQPEPGNFS